VHSEIGDGGRLESVFSKDDEATPIGLILCAGKRGQPLEGPDARDSDSTWSGINRTQVEVGTRACRRLPEVKTIQVHHLGPGRHEIVQELVLRVRASIHFG
jgi:hypothetical protein